MCRLDDDAVICGERAHRAAPICTRPARAAGHRFAAPARRTARRAASPSTSTAFRIAVHRVTGEIRDPAERPRRRRRPVINPMQCRGQVEGGVARGIGWALYERIVIDETGAIVNPQFRNYRIPAYADIPRTRDLFRRHARLDRSARRQGEGRVPDQPGRPGRCPTRWRTPPASASQICRFRPIASSRKLWRSRPAMSKSGRQRKHRHADACAAGARTPSRNGRARTTG